MKKLLSMAMAMLMVCTMVTSSFAAPNNFVESPVNGGSTNVIDFESDDPDDIGKLVITPFSNIDELPAEKREMMMEAYNQIIAAADLSNLNSGLKKLAEAMGIKTSDLLVSDMFDVSYYPAENEDPENGTFRIRFGGNSLHNFVALLHYYEGSWHIVDNASVNSDETVLTFRIKDFSPFAIVVHSENGGSTGGDSGSGNNSPQTGPSMMPMICGGVAVVFAVAGVAFFLNSKKKSA